MTPTLFSIFLWSSLSCQSDTGGQVQIVRNTSTEVAEAWDTTIEEPDSTWFARASLDIRGHRPSPSELADWAADPSLADDFLDNWLSDPAFAHQFAWYWNDVFHTAVWIGQAEKFQRFLLSSEEQRTIGWEPMAFIEQTLLEYQPFTDVVEGSQLPSNPVFAEIFGDTLDEEGWQWIEPTREHVAAGVMGSRVLWMRQYVDFLNHNRARANFVTSSFLCMDYLEREVTFDFSEISLDAIESAILTQPECVACHSSLDPLASVFGTFQDGVNLHLDQMGMPSTFKERWYAGWREPGYFGLPMNTMSDLGAYIASDSRFAQCMVTRTWEFMVPETSLDDLDVFTLASQFTESDYDMRDLVKRVVTSEAYQHQSHRILRPEQLLGTLEWLGVDITTAEGSELAEILWSPERRVMFGSTDDVGVLSSNASFTVGHHVQLEWVSSQLTEILSQDLTRQQERRVLLTKVGNDPHDESVLAQLVHWKQSLHSEYVTESDESIQTLFEIWSQLATESELKAWATVLAILVHDPKMVLR
jgi:hypothetical protein